MANGSTQRKRRKARSSRRAATPGGMTAPRTGQERSPQTSQARSRNGATKRQRSKGGVNWVTMAAGLVALGVTAFLLAR